MSQSGPTSYEDLWYSIYLFIYLFGARKADRFTDVLKEMWVEFKCLKRIHVRV